MKLSIPLIQEWWIILKPLPPAPWFHQTGVKKLKMNIVPDCPLCNVLDNMDVMNHFKKGVLDRSTCREPVHDDVDDHLEKMSYRNALFARSQSIQFFSVFN